MSVSLLLIVSVEKSGKPTLPTALKDFLSVRLIVVV